MRSQTKTTTVEKKNEYADNGYESRGNYIGGIILIQNIRNDVSTLTDIAIAIHSMICKEALRNNKVDVVFDTYEDISIYILWGGHKEEKNKASGSIVLQQLN